MSQGSGLLRARERATLGSSPFRILRGFFFIAEEVVGCEAAEISLGEHSTDLQFCHRPQVIVPALLSS